MKRWVSLLPVLAILLPGCSEEPLGPEPPEESPVVWERLDLPEVTSVVLGLEAGEEDLFALGDRHFWTLDRSGDVHGLHSVFRIPTDRARPFLGAEYFAYPIYPLDGSFPYATNLGIDLRGTGDRLPARAQLPLAVLDPGLSGKAGYLATNRQRVAVIDGGGRMLAPVIDADPSRGSAFVYMVRLSTDRGVVSVDPVGRIEWPYEPFWMMTAGGRFFASTVRALYEIRWDGSIDKLADQGAWDIAEFNGKLVLDGLEGIRVSADGGATWQPVAYGEKGTFFRVGESLCLLRGLGISVIDLDAGTSTPVSPDGLPVFSGSPWMDAARFGDRVYVATTEGLYAKPVEEFFTPPAR